MAIDLNKLKEVHDKLNENPKTRSNNGDFLKNFYQMQNGKNAVRILPSRDEDQELEFYAHTKIHRVGIGEGKFRNYHCRQIHNEECALCGFYKELWNEPYARDEHKDLARSIKGRDRYYLNVIDRNAQETGDEQVVKILSLPPTLFKSMIDNMMDPDEAVDLIDMDEGHDFIIARKIEDNGFPKYDGSQPRIKPSTAHRNEQERQIVLDQRHDLQSLVKKYDYEEGLQLVAGMRPDLSYEGQSGLDG